MRPGVRGALYCLLLASRTVEPSAAQEPIPIDEPWRYSEVRLGILAHDARFAGGVEGGVDLNGEVDSRTLVDPAWTADMPLWVQVILHPRAHFGIEPNLNGKTSQIYAGLTWSGILARDLIHLNDDLEFSLLAGPALNDGNHSPHGPGTKALGSNILFHLAGELSYRITPRIALGLYFDHSSNGGFARYNDSLNDFGLRIGYRF